MLSVIYLVIYQRLKFNSVVTKAVLFPIILAPLKNHLLHRVGIQARALIFFMFCSQGRLFKRALNQDRAVKRLSMVL